MSAANQRRVVLVTRKTRLEELVVRHNTLAQAKFYIEHLGDDFSDYLKENEAYATSLRISVEALARWGRYQLVDRMMLPNFVFAPDDIVVTLGQDGVVASTLKYLEGQPLLGLNPDPARWDGLLLPFQPGQLHDVLPLVAQERRPIRSVTTAQARLSDGQTMRAVNDLFIGPRSHTSALYELEFAGTSEFQSSSGLIVSTGLGSTAWMKSVATGSLAIAGAFGAAAGGSYAPLAWDAKELLFAVREPFPSRGTSMAVVFGHIERGRCLMVRSRMPESGVIFSDGIESDFLRFTAGMTATIDIAPAQGRLVQ